MLKMEQESEAVLEEGRPRRRWRSALIWSGLLALGWALYECTHQPVLGVAAICVKFGWRDFRTAIWLRRVDPDRHRGWACCWLYLSSGLWKTAIAGSALMFLVPMVLISPPPGPQQPKAAGPPVQFVTAGITALVGFGSSAVTLGIALWLALRYRVRLWLSRIVYRPRRGGGWPPLTRYPGDPNRAGRLLTTALVTAALPVILLVIVVLGIALLGDAPAQPANPSGVRVVLFMIVMGVCLIGGPIAILIVREVLSRRVLANAPWECWCSGAELDEDPQEEGWEEPGEGY